MRQVKAFILGLAIGAVGVILYYQFNPIKVETVRVEYKNRVVTETKYVDVPKIVSVVLPPDTFLQDVDTSRIVEEYKRLWAEHHTKRSYSDTLVFDSVGTCVLNQTVYRNRLLGYDYTYNINYRKKTIYQVVKQPSEWHLQAILGAKMAAPMVMYRKDKISAGIGFNLQNKGMLFTVGYRLK